jgi:citrate synthase
MQNYNPGLEGIVVGTTEISYIDGAEGRLLYRGYAIHDLVKATFEEVAYLLWNGALPTTEQLAPFKKSLVGERALPGEILDFIRKIPLSAAPMDALRTAVSALALYDAEANDNSPAANQRKAIRLTSKMGSIVAALGRARERKNFVEPDGTLDHAANLLFMLFGRRVEDFHVRAMDASLILHADHEMNASTFAARVTAATLSDMYSAVTSAIGTLKGPLHGGQNEAAMRMLLEIGDEDHAGAWVRAALQEKRQIPGFGHRLYTAQDPRAIQLRQLSEEQSRRVGNMNWYNITRVIEDHVTKETGLYPNVDLYSASAYYLMGIPVNLFTPLFAASRVCGWTAHLFEQYAHNRLIRPEGEYVGPMRREFIPLETRKARASCPSRKSPRNNTRASAARRCAFANPVKSPCSTPTARCGRPMSPTVSGGPCWLSGRCVLPGARRFSKPFGNPACHPPATRTPTRCNCWPPTLPARWTRSASCA